MLDQYEKEVQRIKEKQDKEKKDKDNSFYGTNDGQDDSKEKQTATTKDATSPTTAQKDLHQTKGSAEEGGFEKKAAEAISPSHNDKAKLKKNQLEGLDPREVSKNILLKCNVIRPRKTNAPVLHKGEGHMFSNSEKSLRQVYTEVYYDSPFVKRNLH